MIEAPVVRSHPDVATGPPGEIEAVALLGIVLKDSSVAGEAVSGEVVGWALYGGGGEAIGSVKYKRYFYQVCENSTEGKEKGSHTVRSYHSGRIHDSLRRRVSLGELDCIVSPSPFARIIRRCRKAGRAAQRHGRRSDGRRSRERGRDAVQREWRAERRRGYGRQQGIAVAVSVDSERRGAQSRRRLGQLSTTQWWHGRRRKRNGGESMLLLLPVGVRV